MEQTAPAQASSVTFETSPDQYKHWKLTFDGPVATLGHGRPGRRRPPSRLQAQTEFLRPGRGHRAGRCAPATPLRASRSADRRSDEPQAADLLRRRQHLHARLLESWLQGELLQVHQRNSLRHGRHERQQRHQVPGGAQWDLRWRRLRAGARVRRDFPGRRRQRVGGVAGNAAAWCAARDRRPDARGRQTQSAARPGRRVQHLGGRRSRQARSGMAAGRQSRAAQQLQGRGGAACEGARRWFGPSRLGSGHHAGAAQPDG